MKRIVFEVFFVFVVLGILVVPVCADTVLADDVSQEKSLQQQKSIIVNSKFVFDWVFNQVAGQQFLVRVYAIKSDGSIDTRYDKNVTIKYCCGYITRGNSTIKFSRGVGVYNISLSNPGTNVQLFVHESGNSSIVSYSNKFNVTTNRPIRLSMLSGRVVDITGKNIPHVSITLSNENNSYTVVSDNRGNYSISNIVPGVYTLSTNYVNNGFNVTIDDNIVYLREGSLTNKTIKLNTCNAAGTNPVLLLHGISGSTIDPAWFSVLPVLPEKNSSIIRWDNFVKVSSNFGLHDPYSKVGWGDLINNLKRNKYYVGCTIFPVPYDWRIDLDSVVDNYLVKWIDEAKRRTGAQKVDIVAHSMGGLVARAYIQGNSYRYDVDKLLLVGTPDYGSPNVYYLVEGGDPSELDKFVHNLNTVWFPSYTRNFNRDLTNSLYILEYGREMYIDSRYNYNKANVKNFYNEHVPSLKALMPVFPFLYYNGSPNNSVCVTNDWLINLSNNNSNLTRVNAASIKGVGYKTISGFDVTNINCSNQLYPDGEIIPNTFHGTDTDGDGTVLRGYVVTSNNKTIRSGHTNLIKNSVSNIISFLRTGNFLKQLQENNLNNNLQYTEGIIRQANIIINLFDNSIEDLSIELSDGNYVNINNVREFNNVSITDVGNNKVVVNINFGDNVSYKIFAKQDVDAFVSCITNNDTESLEYNRVKSIDISCKF